MVPRRGAAARVVAPVLLVACGAAAPGPRELVLGVDACAYCGMLIDDPDRAAEWVDDDGHVHTFDEPGCLLAWLQREAPAAGDAYLADAAGSGWVPAASASLVRGAIRTPMGYDLVAFRDRAAADQAASAADTRSAGSTGSTGGLAAMAGAVVLDWGTALRVGVGDARAN